MASIKLTPITLDKDQWENVPNLVFKSFYAFSMNMQNIKQWAVKQEQHSKSQSEQVQQLDLRISSTDVTLKSTQEQLQEISGAISTMSEQSRNQTDTFATCIRQLLCASRVFFAHFGKAFDIADLVLEGEEEELVYGKNADVDVLRELGSNLETRLDAMGEAFETWDMMRETEEEKRTSMQGIIEELRVAAERSRDRLLTWREMLRESSHVVDSLGAALVATQSSVRELQDTQVTAVDVDEAVRNKGKELQELLGCTDQRVDGIAEHVEGHIAEVERATRETRRLTDERIEDHSAQVSQMLERSINPINAYLNTMHVKADVARSELDQLRERTPKLAAQLEELDRRLANLGERDSQRADELGGRVEELASGLVDQREGQHVRQAELASRVEEVARELGESVEGVRVALEDTAGSLDSVRAVELTGVRDDLSTLEQKVARWVRAHPLPVKISEARLYALEARLAEEMDARLQLEELIRLGHGQRKDTAPQMYKLGYTMPKQGAALPSLQMQQQEGGGKAPGSARGASRKRQLGLHRPGEATAEVGPGFDLGVTV